MMSSVKKCCVPNCNKTRDDDTILHLFPNPIKNRDRFELWVNAIAGEILFLDNRTVFDCRRVCHIHFEPRYYTRSKRLSPAAVPTLHLQEKKQIDHTYSRKRHYDHSYFKALKSHQDLLIGPTSLPKLTTQEVEASNSGLEATLAALETGQSQNDGTDKKIPAIPGSYTIVIRQETDESTQNDEVFQKPNATVKEWNEAVQKQNDTVRKKNDTVRKKNDTVRKKTVLPEKQQTVVVKVTKHAELPVVAETELLVEKAYTMDMNEDDDHGLHDDDHDHSLDDDHPWRVEYDNDDDRDVAVSFAQYTDQQLIEDEVVIESQPEEQTSHTEEVDSSHETESSENIKEEQVAEYGQCRCCLQPGTHGVVDVIQVLGCFNIPVATDPRVSRLVCTTCDKFLQEARRFRDMVVDSQKVLLDSLANSDVKYPSVWSNPSGLTTAHEDEFEQELIYIQQQSGWQALELTDDAGIQDEFYDEDPKVDLGMLDEGATQERPVFSRLSDYPDAQMGTEVNYENLTTEAFKEMVQENKRKRAKFSTHIRQNLIKILDYSTVLPFLSVTGEKFECIYCDGSFHNIDQLRAHVEESHRNESTDFKHDILKLLPELILYVDVSCIKCKLCDEQFTTIDNLVQHLVETHKKEYHKICLDPPHNVVPFNFSLDVPQCVECGKTFPDYKKLRMHVIKHYGPYLCHQCGSKFLYYKAYSQHMLVHRNYDKNKQSCSECGVNFKSKKLLLYHCYKNHYDIMKKQTGQPDTNIRLNDLAENVKDETRDVAYECTLCNNGTTYTLSAAYMHRIGHLNNTREGPYSCEICGHISTVKKDFRIHLQGHYGIKNYVCIVCKKTFKKNSQLSDHMSTHLNLKFHCPLCDTTLYDKKLLMRHVKNQHPDVNVAFSL